MASDVVTKPADLSPEAFALLGSDRMAYITTMRSEDVGFLTADAPMLAPGHRVFVLHAADGTPILLAGSRESAADDAARHQLETVSVH